VKPSGVGNQGVNLDTKIIFASASFSPLLSRERVRVRVNRSTTLTSFLSLLRRERI
jgi:hypothetical protein